MKIVKITALILFGSLGFGGANAVNGSSKINDVTANFLSRNCNIRKAYGIGARVNLKMFCSGNLRLSRRDILYLDLARLGISSLEIANLYVTSEYRVSAAIVLVAGDNTEQIVFQGSKLKFHGGNLINKSSSIICIDKRGAAVDVVVKDNDFSFANFTIFNGNQRGC